MKNIKIKIEYDGTNYFGWQVQKDRITVQGVLEDTIRALTKEDVKLIGCSRTDTGVHAKEYVANFFTNSTIPSEKFREALNSKLPNDIVILESKEVLEDFHARYNCKGKRYIYSIYNREQPCAIYRNYMYSFTRKLQIEKMKSSCKYIIGTHDFSAFKTKGSSVKTSIRNIHELCITKEEDIIKISVSADGFLYNMVRIIVGTLLDVGTEKIQPEEVKEILESKDRTKAGKVVPACGLCLEKVFY
ncbi:tRNA pseudouridine(38-40) synthase TruA [Haloimpatiens lingqiaonensis]|uniref:tRNA pseudouridine(38-40) synthase TruA n=1 Tax=Haloimpatiens lingqiaonensis TaxID=1380675 RepID=UPI0010FDF693|nr:tRNA pseudouridine(38-40) synthase TruA [Haloimpatiens lingqiaonensis]